jgi:hypothetical protein
LGSILRGRARGVSGEPVEGISWIEEGIEDYRALGSTLGLPCFLALKAEALFAANRNSEALEAIEEAQAVPKSVKYFAGAPNCTGSARCSSRLWMLMRLKLTIRSAQPLKPQSNKNRFRWKTRGKEPTRNTADKKRVRQEDVDSDYLFAAERIDNHAATDQHIQSGTATEAVPPALAFRGVPLREAPRLSRTMRQKLEILFLFSQTEHNILCLEQLLLQ